MTAMRSPAEHPIIVSRAERYGPLAQRGMTDVRRPAKKLVQRIRPRLRGRNAPTRQATRAAPAIEDLTVATEDPREGPPIECLQTREKRHARMIYYAAESKFKKRRAGRSFSYWRDTMAASAAAIRARARSAIA